MGARLEGAEIEAMEMPLPLAASAQPLAPVRGSDPEAAAIVNGQLERLGRVSLPRTPCVLACVRRRRYIDAEWSRF